MTARRSLRRGSDFAVVQSAGRSMAEVDYNVGRMLDAIDRLGIARTTIVFW